MRGFSTVDDLKGSSKVSKPNQFESMIDWPKQKMYRSYLVLRGLVKNISEDIKAIKGGK